MKNLKKYDQYVNESRYQVLDIQLPEQDAYRPAGRDQGVVLQVPGICSTNPGLT